MRPPPRDDAQAKQHPLIRAIHLSSNATASRRPVTWHSRIADTTVKAVVHAIASGAGELGRINPLFAGLDDLFRLLRSDGPAALEFGGVALHAGALRADREAGLLA